MHVPKKTQTLLKSLVVFRVRTKVIGNETDAPKFYPSDSGFAGQVDQFVPIFPTNFRLISSNEKYATCRFSYVISKWLMLMIKKKLR